MDSNEINLFAKQFRIKGFLGVFAVDELSLTLFKPGFFGSLVTRGGADLPPPSKNGGNGWEVPKLSWNLISYRD